MDFDEQIKPEACTPPPALWSPVTTSLLSVFFTPIFGSWIIGKNWNALGLKKRSETAELWKGISIAVLFGGAFLAKHFGYYYGLVYFVIWFFACAKPQIDHIGALPQGYRKKSFFYPAWAGIGIAAISAAYFVFMAPAPNRVSMIEQNATDIVTQIIREQYNSSAICESVSITGKASTDSYNAVANLNNGNSLNINIRAVQDSIYVNIID